MHPTVRRYDTGMSTSSTSSRYSDESQASRSTAPTYYTSSPRPSVQHAATDTPIYSKHQYDQHYDNSPCSTYYPRTSTETYASTVASMEDMYDEPESYDPEYEVHEYREVVETDLRPSDHTDFADFFPSTRRMFIRHDDSSYDGNMNLRVDTETRKKGEAVQLFHMRMHDLKKREFSLRRYERSSGREVCHSSRKYAKPAAEKRPAITKSISNTFASIVRPEMKRRSSGTSQHSHKSSRSRRQDSGYESHDEVDEIDYFRKDKSKQLPIPTNTTKLEFSNYAQVEVKRRGAKSSKRYEFEYWGHKYTWKRVTEKDGHGKAVSYHLYKGDGGPAVAHIVPEMRSPAQIQDEERAGGWVPPCSMWISDKSVLEALTDVADVIVSTGLIALIDDCIKRHFHSRKPTRTHQISVPLTPLNVEFVTPRAMMDHVFKRRDSGSSNKEREQRGSPLRYTNATAGY